jgi:thiol-disulfide isomerase/thioredoxin
MKKILLIAILFASCSQKTYKTFYTVHENKQEKVLQGIISRKAIESDTTFKWFPNNYKYALANTNAVDVFKKNKGKFKMMVFGGTWCEDTQNLLPLFYKLVEQSKYPKRKVTLVGVDREKKSGNELSEKHKITNVPTFIVLNNEGVEIGRVVEYGKGNGIDNELADIVSSIK